MGDATICDDALEAALRVVGDEVALMRQKVEVSEPRGVVALVPAGGGPTVVVSSSVI